MLEMSAPAPSGAPAAAGCWTTYGAARRAAFADVFRRTLEGSADCVELPPSSDSDACMRAFEERGEHSPETSRCSKARPGRRASSSWSRRNERRRSRISAWCPRRGQRPCKAPRGARIRARGRARAKVMRVAVDSRNAPRLPCIAPPASAKIVPFASTMCAESFFEPAGRPESEHVQGLTTGPRGDVFFRGENSFDIPRRPLYHSTCPHRGAVIRPCGQAVWKPTGRPDILPPGETSEAGRRISRIAFSHVTAVRAAAEGDRVEATVAAQWGKCWRTSGAR